MFVDELSDVPAARYDVQPLGTNVVEREAHEPLCQSESAMTSIDLGVGQYDPVCGDAVVGDADDDACQSDLVAAEFGVVADVHIPGRSCCYGAVEYHAQPYLALLAGAVG